MLIKKKKSLIISNLYYKIHIPRNIYSYKSKQHRYSKYLLSCVWRHIRGFVEWMKREYRIRLPESHRMSRSRISWRRSARQKESTRRRSRRKTCKSPAASTRLYRCSWAWLSSPASPRNCHRRCGCIKCVYYSPVCKYILSTIYCATKAYFHEVFCKQLRQCLDTYYIFVKVMLLCFDEIGIVIVRRYIIVFDVGGQMIWWPIHS